MTVEELIAWAQEPQTVSLWGNEYHNFVPPLVSTVLGDGQKLLGIGAIMTRPYYYLVRIDSSMDIDSDEFRCDVLEEALEAIEEDFGNADWPQYDENDNELPDDEKEYGFPMWSDGGCHWWEITPERAQTHTTVIA